MHDAVLEQTMAGLTRFLSTTFFSNEAGLRCCFAAMVMALHGHNIDRAFWTLGAGGVGQSLFSHLIATLFGEGHAFVDMNCYYSDDELRKQAEGMVGKLVVTGQEVPETKRTMREDLYKNTFRLIQCHVDFHTPS